jgi:hypothetical protein
MVKRADVSDESLLDGSRLIARSTALSSSALFSELWDMLNVLFVFDYLVPGLYPSTQ